MWRCHTQSTVCTTSINRSYSASRLAESSKHLPQTVKLECNCNHATILFDFRKAGQLKTYCWHKVYWKSPGKWTVQTVFLSWYMIYNVLHFETGPRSSNDEAGELGSSFLKTVLDDCFTWLTFLILIMKEFRWKWIHFCIKNNSVLLRNGETNSKIYNFLYHRKCQHLDCTTTQYTANGI